MPGLNQMLTVSWNANARTRNWNIYKLEIGNVIYDGSLF